MMCITDKCPLYFGSDGRGSCDVNHYCSKTTECNIDLEISMLKDELEKLLKVEKIISKANEEMEEL